MKKLNYFFLISTCIALFFSSCKQEKKATYFPDMYTYARTVKELNEVVKFVGFAPIVASRNYTYANVAAYECIAAGSPNRFYSLSGQLNDFSYNAAAFAGIKNVDFNFAAILAFCTVGESVTFPEGSMKQYVDSLKEVADDRGMPSDMLNATIAFADTISKVVIGWSKKDNYLQLRSAPKYTVKNEPGRWVPTPPAYASALEPAWSKIRTMVLDSQHAFVPEPPIPYDMENKNGDYYKQVMAVKNAGDSLTDEQKHIAEFWDDLASKLNVIGHAQYVTKKFSPPGHWMNIVGIAAQDSKADFGKTVAAYALTSISMFDSFIECWAEKFRSNMPRPETVINAHIDPDWRPYLQSPPFPEYTCGHSTVSSASAEALTAIFGDNFQYTDSSELEFGIPNRSFKSFRQAADENNWARFYGGIHFHPSCIESTEEGQKIGAYISGKIKIFK